MTASNVRGGRGMSLRQLLTDHIAITVHAYNDDRCTVWEICESCQQEWPCDAMWATAMWQQAQTERDAYRYRLTTLMSCTMHLDQWARGEHEKMNRLARDKKRAATEARYWQMIKVVAHFDAFWRAFRRRVHELHRNGAHDGHY